MAKRSLEDREQVPRQPSNVFVSFSKRRRGLFQKAAELCSKCDAQIAIVVLSPTGNPFAFGHSSVDEVLSHYLCQTTIIPSLLTDEHKQQKQRIEGLKHSLKLQGQISQNRGNTNIDDLVDEHDQDQENYKGVTDLRAWIEKECEERQSVQELEFLKQKLLVLLDKVAKRLETAPYSTTATNEIGIGDSSGGGGGDNHKNELMEDDEAHMMSIIDQNSQDFAFNGCGGLINVGPVGCSDGEGVFDDLDYAALMNLCYNPPDDDMPNTNYYSSPNDMSYPENNYGTTLDYHPPNDMSYSGAVGFTGNHILGLGDAGICLSSDQFTCSNQLHPLNDTLYGAADFFWPVQ
ncbi:MADS-box transcription factor [Trema orientale]|uniref:MADS-box transcription factor n=1 Tax=Trema orientale TaxID=63057 RepID=A0A2P5B888_TREOI|nr:MADS-box transcription factor [Trema orientale]